MTDPLVANAAKDAARKIRVVIEKLQLVEHELEHANNEERLARVLEDAFEAIAPCHPWAEEAIRRVVGRL